MLFRTSKYALDRSRLEAYIRAILTYLQTCDAGLTVCFVTNPSMRKLNKQYKHRDAFTDVLAFPMNETLKDTCGKEQLYLGDIIISLDQARINAREYGTVFFDEVCLYLIHGVLHLLGYEDTSARKKKRMFALQDKIYVSLKKESELCRMNNL